MKVKRSLLLVAVGCGALAFAVLQQVAQKYVLLDDKKGGFKVYDVESALTSFVPNGDVEFDASGRPMKGFSKEQGLSFSALKMEGLASRTDAGSFRIKRGSASGSVVVDLASSADSGATATKSHVESELATLVEGADSTTITLPSTFLFSNHVSSAKVDRLLELRAPSGTFVLPLLDQANGTNNPFQSADVKGPIDITVDSKMTEAKGTNRQYVKLRADKMTYDGKTRILRLDGHITGDVEGTPATGKGYSMTVNAEWVTIELDENSAVKQVRSGIGTATGKGGGQ